MNAIEFLKQDHQELESLFKQVETAPENAQLVLPQIRQALLAHAQIEEQHFYPECERHEELRDMIKEALQEHRQAEKELMQITSQSLDSDEAHTLIQQLHEDVQHHVREEEGELFPKVQRLFEEARLNELGRILETAKTREMINR